MPAPNRSGGRRGGSYSRQRASNQRASASRANGQRRSAPARGGYGNGRSSGGNEQLPLFIGLGAGAIVLVGVLAFLLMSSSGEATVPEVQNHQPEAAPVRPTKVNGPAREVMTPFSSKEKDRICEIIDKLDEDYDRAKELKDEGFLQQDKQNYEAAQKAWQEAHRILCDMDDASNDLELQFGEDVWERIERFLPAQDGILKRWGHLKGDITKQLNLMR